MRVSWKILTPAVVVILAFLGWFTLWRRPRIVDIHVSTTGSHTCDVGNNERNVHVYNNDQLNWIPDTGHTYTIVFDPTTGNPVGSMTILIPHPASTVNGVSGHTYIYTINDASGTQCKDADPKVILK